MMVGPVAWGSGACLARRPGKGSVYLLAMDPATPVPKARRVFARLPHDKQVERSAAQWRTDCSTLQALEMLVPEIERGAFITAGRYMGRCVMTLIRDAEHPDQIPNAVSGWGNSPAESLQDLAFRWVVLCAESWVPSMHVRLVSEIEK